MCGRYYYADKIARRVEEDLGIPLESFFSDKGDITPGMSATSIICGKANPHHYAISELFWGIYSRDKKLIINARAESAAQKPMFSDSFRLRRCILPADGFYEWNKEKTKFTFSRADGRPIYLAGVHDISMERDSFVILTTSANESMLPVHDRMPVMIDRKNVMDFLNDYSAAKGMINETMPELTRKSDYEQLSLF
ncbi:SOS response-associated peptidase [Butyrivibrio sp. AE3004]|uniref:SOS response-associated peptidase n=1 Tax=Butyrivibrio sp. AE3004 TaxID=1506994 RepID=UPI000493BC77|nr:SOS response-associated peptidase [Butyrivibrio sp. AE3004]